MAKGRMETRIDEMGRQIAELIGRCDMLLERVTDLEERIVTLETAEWEEVGDEATLREMEAGDPRE